MMACVNCKDSYLMNVQSVKGKGNKGKYYGINYPILHDYDNSTRNISE